MIKNFTDIIPENVYVNYVNENFFISNSNNIYVCNHLYLNSDNDFIDAIWKKTKRKDAVSYAIKNNLNIMYFEKPKECRIFCFSLHDKNIRFKYEVWNNIKNSHNPFR